MNNLSDATAKGRRYTAGCTKLAVFFLCCLPFFTACPLNASGAVSGAFPYVVNGKLYYFTPDSQQEIGEGYSQSAVTASKKAGYLLAWNQKKQRLYHFAGQRNASNVELKASLVYAGAEYILTQASSFTENKGFPFTLYSIKYSMNGKKIKLRSIWNGYADCFVSDFFFTEDGICIAGGTRDDTKNNVFYITEKGIHKCFSTEKDSDFLRLVRPGDSKNVFAFVSTRDKSERDPVLYSFDITEAPEQAVTINLSGDSLLSADFDCFFGYGFATTTIILPASIKGTIQFICYDINAKKILSVITDAVGCVAPLASTEDGTYYLARDPLTEGSWSGISLFTGTECKKIKAF